MIDYRKAEPATPASTVNYRKAGRSHEATPGVDGIVRLAAGEYVVLR